MNFFKFGPAVDGSDPLSFDKCQEINQLVRKMQPLHKSKSLNTFISHIVVFIQFIII